MENEEVFIKINLDLLVKSSKPVIKKYPFFYEREIDMLNRFIVQTGEEVQEFIMEDYTDGNIDNKMDELVDIILYLCSIMATLKYIYGVDYKFNTKNLKLFDIFENIPIDKFNGNTKYILTEYMDTNVSSIVYDLLFNKIRRHYPERKYHKIITAEGLKEKGINIKERSLDTYKYIGESIYELLELTGEFQFIYGEGKGSQYFFNRLLKKLKKNYELNSK